MLPRFLPTVLSDCTSPEQISSPAAFNVPQCGYEVIAPHDTQTRLVTRNVTFCTVFIGVNKAKSSAFMCHLDLPPSINALDELVALITQEHGSLAEFELYAVSILSPYMRLLCIALLTWLVHAMVGPRIAAGCFVLFAWAGLWVQFKCYQAARKHFQSRIHWGVLPTFAGILRTLGVAVDLSAQKIVDVWWDEKGIDMAPWKSKPFRFRAARVRNDISA